MYIDSIENGIVLDHITAGRGMRVYETLGLDALDCTVARQGRRIKLNYPSTACLSSPHSIPLSVVLD